MKLGSIVKRVQAKLSDPEGTYADDDYVLGFCQDGYEWLYNKLILCGYKFADWEVELPNITAGLPNLDQYMEEGQPLYGLVNPKTLEWKLAGANPTLYQLADGPLDFVRDLLPGANAIDSWAFNHDSILLSNFACNLDLRISGEFTLDPLVDLSSRIETPRTAASALVFIISAMCAIERGNPSWVQTYTAAADEAIDDISIKLVKDTQGTPRRLGRINRRKFPGSGPIVFQQ